MRKTEVDYSIVIPAYDEELLLPSTLVALGEAMTGISLEGEIIVVDTEDDPDNEDKRRFTFSAVEGFVPPSSVELATTATEHPTTPADGELPPPDVT